MSRIVFRALQATSIPIRFIWGMLDEVAPLQIARELSLLLPPSTSLVLIRAGHWPFVVRPISSFLILFTFCFQEAPQEFQDAFLKD